ncbi:hypothetical protein DIS24_g5616 [Lasiodiplodia hormozganensis]|uniref:F-box domain-containing protein n=1 Tax=Lasiodiplodia hormozganensis TaxID=869390 RepID=A0AA39YMV1_9PEZI|nr:hypothetical protein DIS24_g5616 [Lasiodiplodia hormozganensis]
MDSLPDELILYVATCNPVLEPLDIISLQAVSRRFLRVFRDDRLWKAICYQHSRAEAIRRRQQLLSHMTPHMAELASAVQERSPASPNPEMAAHRLAAAQRQRAFANWDPSYPGESISFYEEFIARHAPVQMSWLQQAYGDDREPAEATGLGVYYDEATRMADRIFAPLNDGSIGVWDINTKQGAMVGRTEPGFLAGNAPLAESKAVMTETGAVECVSIDNRQNKGYFAVLNVLKEVDLETLQVVSESKYPFPITTLSEARHPTPVTVGTNMTIHLHDPRQQQSMDDSTLPLRCELIAGTPPKDSFSDVLLGNVPRKHAALSQPGPLSILHLPDREWDGNGDIWVAGRFTSLLNYDRRFFPRLRGTVHSGARLSSMALIHHPFIPRNLGFHSMSLDNAVHRDPSVTGHTIIAAGEYKGKGALELFGLSADPRHTILSSDTGSAVRNRGACIQNRQTASSSKLLSVTTHGARLVYSDGDGNVKWMERDGFTPIRSFNINPDRSDPSHQAHAPRDDGPFDVGTLFSAPTQQHGEGDIVQKLVPTLCRSSVDSAHDTALNKDHLVVWTGDGRIGLLGFGTRPLFEQGDFEERVESAEELAKRTREQEYGRTMRRALERQAADVRFVRGLGLGSASNW